MFEFILGFIIGAVACVFSAVVWVSRAELADIVRIWNEEPDENMRTWFVWLRRLFHGGPTRQK